MFVIFLIIGFGIGFLLCRNKQEPLIIENKVGEQPQEQDMDDPNVLLQQQLGDAQTEVIRLKAVIEGLNNAKTVNPKIYAVKKQRANGDGMFNIKSSGNHKILATSEGYRNEKDMDRTIALFNPSEVKTETKI